MKQSRIKICFIARPTHDKFVTAIYKELCDNICPDIAAGFLTSNAKETRYIKKTIRNADIRIHEVSGYFKKYWDQFTYERFVLFESKYDCSPIWNIIYTDRFLINRSYDDCVKITTGYFCFFESIFKDGRYEFYYDEAIATLQSYIAYIVGRKYGVYYFSQTISRGGLDLKYHYIQDDPFQSDILFEQGYLKKKYDKDEMQRADSYLKEFERHEIIPAYMKSNGKKPVINADVLLSPLRYLKVRTNPYCNDPYFYMYYQAYKHAFDPLLFYIRYHCSKKYYHDADVTRKYVYYPLHYEPEASTLVCASKYEKQLYFIDSWAKSLPADTVLYVKEHYTYLGNRPVSFYKSLKKYPNVVLIDPWVSSRRLILHAQAVTTLTGSAGFEAMLLRKPVILGGNIFFENAPGVVKVDDIYGKYIPVMEQWKQPAREEILQYLCAYFRSLREGCSNQEEQIALSKDNIHNIALSIMEQIQRKQAETGGKNAES